MARRLLEPAHERAAGCCSEGLSMRCPILTCVFYDFVMSVGQGLAREPKSNDGQVLE